MLLKGAYCVGEHFVALQGVLWGRFDQSFFRVWGRFDQIGDVLTKSGTF